MPKQQILEKELMRIKFEEHEEYTSEIIEVKYNNLWIPILANNKGFSTLNYWNDKGRATKRLNFLKSKKKKIYYQLNDDDFLLKLDYCLEESNVLHIRYQLSNSKAMEISKLGVKYSILLDNNPDFTWIPHLRPKKNYVMGDHIFRSPVIIYKKNNIALAFIPDLKTLGMNRPYKTFINFNNKTNKPPQIFYGFGNYEPVEHTFFMHDPSRIWEIPKMTDLTFRYYIIAFIDKNKSEILKSINHFFWEKYIRRNLYEGLKPQILPFEVNVQEGIKAILERHQFWGNFRINNEECGGIWQRSWAGSKKKEIEYISPDNLAQHRERNAVEIVSSDKGFHKFINEMIFDPEKVKWFDKYTRRHAFVPRIASAWQNAWFLNIRTAYGMKFFAEKWNDDDLQEKVDRLINTIINLPRNNGIFPSVLFPTQEDSEVISYINGVKAGLYSDEYNIIDACLAMYWALKISKDITKSVRIVERSNELFELLKLIQLHNGAIPIFVDIKNGNVEISQTLLHSASSGAMIMFLTELYKITPRNEILIMAEEIAEYINKEILPKNKWHDFEPFFSWTKLPLDFFDPFTKTHVMNTLSIYWCAEGFKELFKITNKREYLLRGEFILAILSLFQQVWDMPYISYNTFGGFGVQNADVELGDARQGLFVRTYIDYYLLTDNEEYMERGIAALRASFALQLLPEFQDTCPGNVNNIDTINSVDKGSIYENYGHTGTDYRVPGQITFDWGVGTAVMATAYAKKHLGDIFIDFRRKFVFGIDNILIKHFEFRERKVEIILEHFNDFNKMLIKARMAQYNPVEIVLNNVSKGIFDKKLLELGHEIQI